jgi:hypothetical protein
MTPCLPYGPADVMHHVWYRPTRSTRWRIVGEATTMRDAMRAMTRLMDTHSDGDWLCRDATRNDPNHDRR